MGEHVAGEAGRDRLGGEVRAICAGARGIRVVLVTRAMEHREEGREAQARGPDHRHQSSGRRSDGLRRVDAVRARRARARVRGRRRLLQGHSHPTHAGRGGCLRAGQKRRLLQRTGGLRGRLHQIHAHLADADGRDRRAQPKTGARHGPIAVPGGHREQRTGSPEPRGWKTKRSSRGVRIQDDERPERPDRSEHDGPG